MTTNLMKLCAAVGVVVALSFAITDRFWLQVLTLALLWATAGIGWNLTASAGQISLGHSAFTGIGAYTFAFLYANYDVSPWVGMVVAMVLAAGAAVLIGIPTFRLQGFYFTLATMAFPLILMLLVIHLGYPEISVPLELERSMWAMQFRDPRAYVWVALGLFTLALGIALAVRAARFGRALAAIKDNEVLARSVGIRTFPWKLAAFALSAAICAAVGVVWVNAVLLVVTAEETFGLSVVILMLSVTFVGGIGTPWGPVVGAAILIPVGQLLTAQIGDRMPGAETLVYGLALVAAALLVPRGIVPTLTSLRERKTRAVPEAVDRPPDPERHGQEAVASPRSAVGTPPGQPVLSIEHVQKSFGGVTVLQDVSFEVPLRGRVGLIGPNGAGKTTLFNLLTGHLHPDGGDIKFDGRDIAALKAPARCGLGIARTFQVPQGFASMTPWENVHIAAIGAGMGAGAHDAVDRALSSVGLANKGGSPLSTLTTFDFKLLELARSTVAEPRVLLLDEPLAGLTKSERRLYFEVLSSVAGAETAVVVIEHSVRSLLSFVDELVALDQGRIVASGAPDEVVGNPKVVEAYLGKRWADQQKPDERPLSPMPGGC